MAHATKRQYAVIPFDVKVFWSDEDKCYIATCDLFPSSSAFADTIGGAVAEYRTAFELLVKCVLEDQALAAKKRKEERKRKK